MAAAPPPLPPGYVAGPPRSEMPTHIRLLEFAKTALIKIFLFPYASVCELYCCQVPDEPKWDEALIGHDIGIGKMWKLLEFAKFGMPGKPEEDLHF